MSNVINNNNQPHFPGETAPVNNNPINVAVLTTTNPVKGGIFSSFLGSGNNYNQSSLETRIFSLTSSLYQISILTFSNNFLFKKTKTLSCNQFMRHQFIA